LLHLILFGNIFSSVTIVYAEDKTPKCIADWVAQGEYINFNGHKVFVHASGPKGKEGVLVVHGYPGSSWDFANVVGPVSKKTRIVVPDMIGFGHSDTPLTGTFKDNFSLVKHAILLNGSTIVDLIKTTPGQDASLKLPDKALTEDPPREEWHKDISGEILHLAKLQFINPVIKHSVRG
jgi:pimeloyl-ACP methyl ester carboxylesterase